MSKDLTEVATEFASGAAEELGLPKTPKEAGGATVRGIRKLGKKLDLGLRDLAKEAAAKLTKWADK